MLHIRFSMIVSVAAVEWKVRCRFCGVSDDAPDVAVAAFQDEIVARRHIREFRADGIVGLRECPKSTRSTGPASPRRQSAVPRTPARSAARNSL